MTRSGVAFAILALTLAPACLAKPVGRMVPAPPLSAARIAALPQAQRAAWTSYLQRSDLLRARDKAALATERAGLSAVPAPPPHGSTRSMPLDKPADWYGSAEARRIADNIVSYQTPAGGWGKNQDRSARPRRQGESYVISEKLPPEARGDIITDNWSLVYVGTIDNGATITELQFLARVQQALPGADGAAYRTAFDKGMRYLLAAQYPNGGWPQIYPLQGGYHNAITFNDDAMADVVSLMMDAAARNGDYAFVAPELAASAQLAVDRAVAVILASQIVVEGKRTGWGQQHDPITLAPVAARNFEPVALSSNESAALLRLLMRMPRPSPKLIAAVHDGAAWLQRTAIHDHEWAPATTTESRRLIRKPGAGPIWSRLYDIKTMKPIFGDRDRTVYDDVKDLIPERRNGYSWYGSSPASALKAYAKWSVAHPRR